MGMRLDLRGIWSFAFGEGKAPPATKDTIRLPGTTETEGKGLVGIEEKQTDYLSRVRPYVGSAWYVREVEIPADWQGCTVQLFLERTKPAAVWVDGQRVSESAETIVPQVHDLTAHMRPGKHTLAVCVNNDLTAFPKCAPNSHQYTDHTQTNWNGITGKMELVALPGTHIESCVAVAHAKQGTFALCVECVSERNGPARLWVKAAAYKQGEKLRVTRKECFDVELRAGKTRLQIDYVVEEPLYWDEFSPAYYEIELALEGHSYTTRAGFCEAERQGRKLLVNGVAASLRGTVDCAIFPQTGFAPTTVAAWLDLLLKMQEYGLNHYRFHSWCPPRAAFAAADRLGVYLQVEMPCFSDRLYPEGHAEHDPLLYPFLEDQAAKILKAFGNHPSFMIFATGNEMYGDPALFKRLVEHYRSVRPDKLYMQGANNFFTEPFALEGDDMWVTMRTTPAHNVRASYGHSDSPPYGYLHTGEAPDTLHEHGEALEQSPLPLIAHEVGQYQIFPDLAETDDYTGPLYPTALRLIERELEEKGLRDMAEPFRHTTGQLAVQCYREDIEGILRTKDMAGFQLLGLQDFPGQGTALVGVLDSMLRSKGLIRPEQWRQFCAPQVLLARFGGYTYSAGEWFVADIQVYNYGAAAIEGGITVTICDGAAALCEQELVGVSAPRGALTDAGPVGITLPQVEKAQRLELRLKVGRIENTYPLWVYPSAGEEPADNVHVTGTLDEGAKAALQQGGTVVLFSDKAKEGCSVEGSFAPDFWCYSMFYKGCIREGKPFAPGTMGLVIESGHGALAEFPTRSYAEWQWHPIFFHSRPPRLDRLPVKPEPIVRVVDNCNRNLELGLLLEVAVENGRLIVAASDVLGHMDKPEVRAYYNSLVRYAKMAPAGGGQGLPFESMAELFEG